MEAKVQQYLKQREATLRAELDALIQSRGSLDGLISDLTALKAHLNETGLALLELAKATKRADEEV